MSPHLISGACQLSCSSEVLSTCCALHLLSCRLMKQICAMWNAHRLTSAHVMPLALKMHAV